MSKVEMPIRFMDFTNMGLSKRAFGRLMKGLVSNTSLSSLEFLGLGGADVDIGRVRGLHK
jgi:hypothetical protein